MEVKFKVWIEKNGKHVIGKGGAEILKAIKEHGSISQAAKSLKMSYKYVWNYLNKIERVLGNKVVERERGGKEGGKTSLTSLGEEILAIYNNVFEKVVEGCFKVGVVESISENRITIVFDESLEFKKGDKVLLSKIMD
ncbi:MAG: winged helix-turn-helix domain-containing protein [Archaeoglobaceae archaeon]|nr:winged helix-turn-helix domain-containing protein [Archaeoglobaceae archaeon]